MHFNIITLFPEMFPGVNGFALAGKALEKGLWSFEAINPRSFTHDVHNSVDDTPYGGGAGMVLKPDILAKSVDYAIEKYGNLGVAIYLSPRGVSLNQSFIDNLISKPSTINHQHITILCGRYEGVDQRLLDKYGFQEVSIGDYILSGGEIAAGVLIDACVRKLNGVIGNQNTHDEESFSLPESEFLLEYPHYTRPDIWQGIQVPEVLKSGNHKEIRKWRLEQAEKITQKNRPDLWLKYKG
ncbi:MAG: tRNA (guanosine(37)-N1)-methyltransferase TrmD [Rickettsiales bacterium]|nr:tRNA (guanosine(37)-N1)-methyltransferase TrmD [Rickettsiales bacterium]